jgi:hypothetical protein
MGHAVCSVPNLIHSLYYVTDIGKEPINIDR